MNGLRLFLVAMVVGVVIWLAPSSDLTVHAQQPAPSSATGSRRVLDRHDLSVPGREGVLVHVELAPGEKEPRHTHPGDLFGYVLEGTFTLVADGKPDTTVKPGESFFVPAGQIHSGQNLGATPAKVLVSFFVEKGKSLTSPVQ